MYTGLARMLVNAAHVHLENAHVPASRSFTHSFRRKEEKKQTQKNPQRFSVFVRPQQSTHQMCVTNVFCLQYNIYSGRRGRPSWLSDMNNVTFWVFTQVLKRRDRSQSRWNLHLLGKYLFRFDFLQEFNPFPKNEQIIEESAVLNRQVSSDDISRSHVSCISRHKAKKKTKQTNQPSNVKYTKYTNYKCTFSSQ